MLRHALHGPGGALLRKPEAIGWGSRGAPGTHFACIEGVGRGRLPGTLPGSMHGYKGGCPHPAHSSTTRKGGVVQLAGSGAQHVLDSEVDMPRLRLWGGGGRGSWKRVWHMWLMRVSSGT